MVRAEGPNPPDLAVLHAAFRSAGFEPRPLALDRIGTGVKGVVFRVEFEDAPPLALKLYRLPSAAQRERVAYELAVGQVSELPTIYASADSAPGIEHGFVLMSLSDGVPANQFLAGMPRARLLAIYAEVGRIQSEFHAIGAPTFSIVAGATNGVDTNREFMLDRMHVSLEGFVRHGGNRYLAGRARDYVLERAQLFDLCPRPVVIHGDLHLENVLIDPARVARVVNVIDLEQSYAADPALDIVRTCHHAAHEMAPDLYQAFLRGYGEFPQWLTRVFDLYFLYAEFETWNFFADGGSRRPLRSISRRIARAVGASDLRMLRSAARRKLGG